jgi:hypothetical protein
MSYGISLPFHNDKDDSPECQVNDLTHILSLKNVLRKEGSYLTTGSVPIRAAFMERLPLQKELRLLSGTLPGSLSDPSQGEKQCLMT